MRGELLIIVFRPDLFEVLLKAEAGVVDLLCVIASDKAVVSRLELDRCDVRLSVGEAEDEAELPRIFG